MKIERRGKYAGIKLHLDKGECLEILDTITLGLSAACLMRIREKIRKAITDDPTILDDRTEEEIHATLSKEAIESKLKLEKMGLKEDWKKVKVEVKE